MVDRLLKSNAKVKSWLADDFAKAQKLKSASPVTNLEMMQLGLRKGRDGVLVPSEPLSESSKANTAKPLAVPTKVKHEIKVSSNSPFIKSQPILVKDEPGYTAPNTLDHQAQDLGAENNKLSEEIKLLKSKVKDLQAQKSTNEKLKQSKKALESIIQSLSRGSKS